VSQSLSWTNDVLIELGDYIPLEILPQRCLGVATRSRIGKKIPQGGQKLSAILSYYGLRLVGAGIMFSPNAR